MRHITVRSACHQAADELSVVAVRADCPDAPEPTLLRSKGGGLTLELSTLLQGVRLAAMLHTRDQPLSQVTIQGSPRAVEALELYRRTGTLTPGGETLLKPLTHLVGLAESHGGTSNQAALPKHTKPGFTVAFSPEGNDSMLLELATQKADDLLRHQQKRFKAWRLSPEDQKWVDKKKATIVYTDGSTLAGEGYSAWSWWVSETEHASGIVECHTSAQAETVAVCEALESLSGNVLVLSDFTFSTAGFKGAMSPQQALLARRYIHLVQKRRVRLAHVKGHGHCPGNIMADKLAGDLVRASWRALNEDPAAVMDHRQRWQEAQRAVRTARVRADQHYQAQHYAGR